MLSIRVCIGSSCHLNGSYNIVHTIQQLIEEAQLHDRIGLEAVFCRKECHKSGVSVLVNEKPYRIDSQSAKEFFQTTIEPLAKKAAE